MVVNFAPGPELNRLRPMLYEIGVTRLEEPPSTLESSDRRREP
jgi:hypothetical protein